MLIGVEYETLDYFAGKKVYAQLFSCGSLPNNGYTSFFVFSKSITRLVTAYGYALKDDNNFHMIPRSFKNQDIWFAIYTDGFYIGTNFDATQFTSSYIVFKYTKD